MANSFGRDLTTGSVPRQLITFALPIFMGNLVSTGYNIVNAAWVGNLLGGNAVGAVAVVFPIIMILWALTNGICTAASILIARSYGEGTRDQIQAVVNNAWTVACVLSVVVTCAGFFWAGDILRLMGTPSELLGMSTGYLRLTFLGFAFMCISNLVIAILRGIGDTATPMVFMIIASIINAVLDPLLIMGIGPFPKLGLNGTAVATLFATGLATIAGLIYIKRKYRGMSVNFTGFALGRKMLSTLLAIGFPAFVQQALLSVSAAFVIFYVNGFGAAAIAAYGVTSRIDSLAIMPAVAIFLSVSMLTAQNIGAGKLERINEIFKWGVLLNCIVIAIISVLVVTLAGRVMHLFVADEAIIVIGARYLAIVGLSYLLFAVSFISNGVINGSGKTVVTMLISFCSLCLVRVPLAAVLARTSLGISGIWLAIAISYAITTVMSLGYYYSGRWKSGKLAGLGTAAVAESLPDLIQA